MTRKVFFAFLLFFVMGALCLSPALADEVEIQPVETLSGGFLYNYGYPDQTFVSFDTRGSIPVPDPNRWYGGTQLNSNTFFVLYDPEMENLDWPNDPNYSLHLSDVFGSSFDHSSLPVSFILGMPQCSISIDTTGYLAGYYRYECDFYFGLQLRPTFLSQASSDGYVQFQPDFTYYSDSYENSSGVITQYMGRVSTTNHLTGFWSRGVTSDLIHLFVSYTFYCDGNTNSVTLSPDFSVLGAITYDCSAVRVIGSASHHSNDCSMFLNTRFKSKLYSNVAPPITPTPTVTPYPGQDTQESINAGVGQIESQVDQIVDLLNPQVSPIPTPPELTIDETPFAEFESMTFPDISDGQPVFSTLWDVFSPLLPFVLVMGTSLTLTFFIMWLLRGGWL